MLDMSGVVISMASSAVVRTRHAAGSYPQASNDANRGKFVPGAASTTTINASMQPLTSRDRQLLPDGVRETARCWMYTTADVRGDSPATTNSITQADTITYGGEIFQVYQDRNWQTDGLYHRSALYSATMEP